MLVHLSNATGSAELEAMKFFCRSHIPPAIQEEIESALQLWAALEERDLLSLDNTQFLRDILSTCTGGRKDLILTLDKFEEERTLHSRPSSLQDSPGVIELAQSFCNVAVKS